MSAELQWGTAGTPTPYPITEDARDALSERGIDVPAELALLLRSATGRERRRFQERIALCKTVDQQRDFIAALLLRRLAPGLGVQREGGEVTTSEQDQVIVREVLEDASEVELNQLMYAYLNGVIPDPKALAEAVRRTQAMYTPRPSAARAAD